MSSGSFNLKISVFSDHFKSHFVTLHFIHPLLSQTVWNKPQKQLIIRLEPTTMFSEVIDDICEF